MMTFMIDKKETQSFPTAIILNCKKKVQKEWQHASNDSHTKQFTRSLHGSHEICTVYNETILARFQV